MAIANEEQFDQQFERILKAAGADTDAALARVLGITQVSVSNAKTRKNVPKTWLTKIHDMFGTSIDWLLYGKKIAFILTGNEATAVRKRIGIRYADTCGNCYHSNGRHDKGGFNAWHCMEHRVEVFDHEVCPDHTRVARGQNGK